MKTFKFFIKSLIVIIVFLISTLTLFIYLQDERLLPEAQEFLKITDNETQIFEESRVFFKDERITLKEDLAKSAPCDVQKATPENEIDFVKSWEEFQSDTKHFETFIHPFLKDKRISIGGSDMSDSLGIVNSTRKFYSFVRAQQCFYQLKKMNKELVGIRKEMADFLVRTLNAPNILLSRLIGFGALRSYLSDFAKDPEMAEFHQSIALFLKKNTAEDIFWESARHDTLMFNNNLINSGNKKLGIEERFENFAAPRGKLINMAWLAYSKRQLPEEAAEISDDDLNWLPRPMLLLKTYKIMVFSRWGDNLDRVTAQWKEMDTILNPN